ncbi:MAG TPA: DNA-3-methyladenine glycosylase [Chloroflexota bacterium]|nr:DNA-3-methyladenine glycosylase [Chloroflexota bacterium]
MTTPERATTERECLLTVDGPFSLPLMLASVLRRANDAVDLVVGDEYRRLLVHAGQPFLLRVAAGEAPDRVRLILRGIDQPPSEAALDLAERSVRRLFCLDHSPEPFYAHVREDPVLEVLTRKLAGMRPLGSPNIFEMLVIAILGQQISMIAAGAIKARMVGALGAAVQFDDRLYRAFPTAEALAGASSDQYLAVAFSRRKAEYTRDLALQVASGELNLEALRGRPHLEILDRLIALRGIGRWTAEYVLLRGYGYPDALPAGDAGLRRQIARYYHLDTAPTEAEIMARAEPWTPYRSWATLYLWNADL